MVKNKEIFNINKAIVPFNKAELEKILSKNIVNGYIATSYDTLIQTLQDISTAQEYTVTLNPNTIFLNSNSPFEQTNVLIQVEGVQTYREFVDNMVHTGNDETWSNFLTYSVLFKDALVNIKLAAYKNFLWNYHNMDAWFTEKNISLINDDKNSMFSDFSIFKSRVLETDDYESFIDCCLDEDIEKAIKYIVKRCCELLGKHRVELNTHIMQDNKNQESIVLKKPIITRIFMQSGAAARCRKDWPKIKFTVLDKKSFDTIGLWDN